MTRFSVRSEWFDMLVDVLFQAADYGQDVEKILSLEGGGLRPMPLTASDGDPGQARKQLSGLDARQLFPRSLSPKGAMAGLYLYFSCFAEAHSIAQDLNTAEGSFWHGIVHRQEPDAANSAYWFRRVGRHPIFPSLQEEADRNRFNTGRDWDPFEFIDFCESGRRRPGSEEERIAMRVQLAEWQLLFDYCAQERSHGGGL